MALLDIQMVRFEEIFLPYIETNRGQTIYERLEGNSFYWKDKLKCYETFFTLTKEEQQFVAELASQTIYSCEQIAIWYLENRKDKNKTKMEVFKRCQTF